MLREYACEVPQWDELLPYPLFADRAVPQALIGLSSFELLYGFQVREPLALVKDSWAQPSNELVTSTAEFVISLRNRLEWFSGEAADNSRSAQEKQKAYYDPKVDNVPSSRMIKHCCYSRCHRRSVRQPGKAHSPKEIQSVPY